MTADNKHPQDATPAEIDAHNYAVARDTALRLLVVGLADDTHERGNAMAQMINALLAAGPTPTAQVLGAITACAVAAIAENHGGRANATDALLAAIAENHGAPLLCPMDCIPCPNPPRCLIASACHRPD